MSDLADKKCKWCRWWASVEYKPETFPIHCFGKCHNRKSKWDGCETAGLGYGCDHFEREPGADDDKE